MQDHLIRVDWNVILRYVDYAFHVKFLDWTRGTPQGDHSLGPDAVNISAAERDCSFGEFNPNHVFRVTDGLFYGSDSLIQMHYQAFAYPSRGSLPHANYLSLSAWPVPFRDDHSNFTGAQV
jgi:hypothetical protein